ACSAGAAWTWGWGSGWGWGSTPSKPIAPNAVSRSGASLGALAGTAGLSVGTTTGMLSPSRSMVSTPLLTSVGWSAGRAGGTTAVTSSTTPRGDALAGTTAVARRPPDVAAIAVTLADRVRVLPAALSRLGAR